MIYKAKLYFLRLSANAINPISTFTLSIPLSIKRLKFMFCLMFPKTASTPSAHLSYNIDDKNKLTLAGSRRINRASVTKLAPFLYRRHFEVYVVGDPELESEYLNNAELTYDTKVGKHSFSLTGFYRGTDNTVFRVNTVTTATENPELNAILGEDVLIRSYTNAGNSTSLGAELNANIVASSFAKFFIGASLYNYQIDGEVLALMWIKTAQTGL